MIILNYEIIFYHSGKTAEIEQTISSKLSSVEMELSQSVAATSPTELAEFLGLSLDRVDAVIIVGGLDGGKQSTDNVLSTVLSTNGSKMESKKIIDENDNSSYIIKCRDQVITVFPDETSVIANMLDKKLISELKETYKLKQKKDDTPPIEKITKELDRQLSSMGRTRVNVQRVSAEEDIKPGRGLKVLKIAVIVLGTLSVVQLLAAGYLYLVNYMF